MLLGLLLGIVSLLIVLNILKMLPGVRDGNFSSGLLNLGRALFVFLFGYGITKVIHFSVEDAYNLDLRDTLGIGYSYARVLSLAIVSGFTLITLNLAEPYVNKQYGTSDYLDLRKRYDLFFGIASLLACLISVHDIFTIYLNGMSKTVGLFSLFITVSMLLLSSGYYGFSYFSCSQGISQKKVLLISNALILVLMSGGIFLTVKSSPPWVLFELREDVKTASNYQVLAAKIEKRVKDYRVLTSSLEAVNANTGRSRVQIDERHSYTKIDTNKAIFCTHFKSKHGHLLRRLDENTKLRRLDDKTKRVDGVSVDVSIIKPGKYCRHYEVKKIPSRRKSGQGGASLDYVLSLIKEEHTN